MTLRSRSFQLSYGPTEDRLHDFYIPALSASVRYDRMTGYFSSHALAIAAAGIAHLIANGGEMRLLVGAQLSLQDVAAIREGHDLRDVVAVQLESALPDPASLTDQLLRDRLAALAWMVSTGALTIRVVLPKGPDGLPRPAPESRDYFHPKEGIFTDAQGDQVVFSGSINESENAWEYHYEQFMVFTSWGPGQAWLTETVGRFERLWEHREPDWISIPVPEAARQRLLRYTPTTAPTRDPLEREERKVREPVPPVLLQPERKREQILARFLQDAPRLVGTAGLGTATCNVLPWPHQQSVVHDVQQSYPSRYLLADEVGLGKTIEAGLVLRQLWLSGIVQRALILAPKSVLRQWQEELYEKFALNVPIYDGTIFYDIDKKELVPETDNPWDSVEMALASSQLVKRQDRQETLIAARPWDLVLVDEAHHARRKDFLDLRRYRPNRLLELLNKLQLRTRGLILMTATPMQVHPIEVWDLLNLLGLSGDWGVDGRHYLHFYEELLEPIDQTDWSTVFRMVRQERDLRGGELDPRIVEIGQELGPVDWERVCKLVDDPRPASTMKKLSPAAQGVAVTLAKEHTPLKRLVFRNTRDLLREYVRHGMLEESVPDRDPQPEWIKMQPEERALYDRIEEYITQFYRKYEEERKGLGFVMTVYRRRLTSSFYAIQRSLERRLAFLKGEAETSIEDEDVEQEALSQDVDELLDQPPALFKEEIEYVEDFLHELSMLGGCDSKVQQLQKDLGEIFLTRDTVLVFTMYTDTMDFLRERLQPSYGRHIACYSGRGGERWDGITWVSVTKEEIKNDFRTGKIKILLCTEAASEGLNLQTCGVLINYDMPWNPMRVEQRIGRIDRIGQRYDTVWVRNYFYEETVEARVYLALSVRIEWFQHVVGRLQPILAQVRRAIQLLAMTPQAERDKKLREQLDRIEKELDSQRGGIDLDEWADQAEGDAALSTPISLEELEAFISRAPTLRGLFRPHETIKGAYWLQGNNPEVVTFDADVFDDHPNTVQLLTYGNPLLDELLGRVAAEPEEQMVLGHVLRVAVDAPLPRVGYYVLDDGDAPLVLGRLSDLEGALDESTEYGEWTPDLIATAHLDLEQRVAEEWASIEREHEKIREAQRTVWEARAARLLMDAALVELTLGQTPDLFGEEQYPQAFNEVAVRGLARHGYPWTALLQIAGQRIQSPRPANQFYLDIQGEAPERLNRRFTKLKQQASELVNDYAAGRRG